MTPEQIILLMESSAKQYICIEAKINATGYITENEEQIIYGVYEITTRWSQSKEYWNISRTIYPTIEHPKTREEVITYAFTDQNTKQLTIESNKTPRGLIRLGGKRNVDQSFITIRMALWEYCNILWGKIHDSLDMSLKYDRISNLYIFKVRVRNPMNASYTFFLDPTRNFIPVKKDILENETLVKKFECSHFKKNINNIWIPYKYIFTNLRENTMECYEVKEVSVNVQIEDSFFDFDFPPETSIIDEQAYIKQKLQM